MDKLTIKNALTKVGITGEKQNEFFAAFEGKSLKDISETDVYNVLEKLDVTGGQALSDFYAAVKEPQIMDQELDLDELEAVAGGNACDDDDSDKDNCTQQLRRCLDTKGCAATVENKINSYEERYIDSFCSLNDGCGKAAVVYVDIQGNNISRDKGDTTFFRQASSAMVGLKS